MLRTAAILAMLVAATPTWAQDNSCIVDYETMQVRAISPSDPVTMLPEQSLRNYDWAYDAVITVAGQDYARYGLPRLLAAGEVDFLGFKDSVPFLREIGTGPDPDVIYGLVDGIECELQPYSRVP